MEMTRQNDAARQVASGIRRGGIARSWSEVFQSMSAEEIDELLADAYQCEGVQTSLSWDEGEQCPVISVSQSYMVDQELHLTVREARLLIGQLYDALQRLSAIRRSRSRAAQGGIPTPDSQVG